MAAAHPHLHPDPLPREFELDYNNLILFGKTTNEYYGFTPFSQNSFSLEERYWLTQEHYMQSKKFCGHPNKIDDIRKIKNPEQIAHYTNDPENSRFINDAWNKNKMQYMYKSLYSKFAQNETIYRQLMHTGNKFLVYATDEDRTWGIGVDRTGKNYLGLLLCLLRTYFLSHPTPLSPAPPPDCVYNFMLLPENRLVGRMRPADEKSPEMSTLSLVSGSILYFGKSDNPFYELSNDTSCAIRLDGKVWLTATHYYQASKFVGSPDLQNIIGTFESPRQARDFAYSKRDFRVRDFETKKDAVMRRALTAKFQQHGNILATLLSTQSRRLVYDCNTDPYWGIGPDNQGLNRLGNLLSELRTSMQPGGYLHKSSSVAPETSPLKTLTPTRHDDIFFFSEAKAYFDFTPYSQHRMFLDGNFWQTVGHYFQAQKFLGNPEIFAEIEACNSASKAWDIAHDAKHVIFIPTSFEKERDEVMHKAISAKIEQHGSVLNSLMETGNRRLMFAAMDTHWGIGADNNGNNTIGKILMDIRARYASRMSKVTLPQPTIRHVLTPPSAHKAVPDLREFNTIYFFKEKDPLYPLTSFSSYAFKFNEMNWLTLNHYFQAQKFKTHPDIQERIRQANNPLQALCIAQDKLEFMISSWKEERVKIMQLGLEVRFEQNPPLKDLLLNTGNVNLVFNNKKDEFWGIGNGSGKNCFGRLLVSIREKYFASHIPFESLKTLFPPIEPKTTAPHHVFNSEFFPPNPHYPTPHGNLVETTCPPVPLPRRVKLTGGVHLRDCSLENAERPSSYSVDKQNHVIIAKNADGEIIASICDTGIRFPTSVCDDEEYLYILCAPTLVKVNKVSGKKVNEVCVQPGNARVVETADSLKVTDEIGENESLYSKDLHKY